MKGVFIMKPSNILLIILFLVVFSAFLLFISPPVLYGQTPFNTTVKATWVYSGSNNSVLLFLYHRPSLCDTTAFERIKPLGAVQSNLQTGVFPIKFWPYSENFFAARNGIVSGVDTLFSKWVFCRYFKELSAPENLKITW
jgi:hypothetical protein